MRFLLGQLEGWFSADVEADEAKDEGCRAENHQSTRTPHDGKLVKIVKFQVKNTRFTCNLQSDQLVLQKTLKGVKVGSDEADPADDWGDIRGSSKISRKHQECIQTERTNNSCHLWTCTDGSHEYSKETGEEGDQEDDSHVDEVVGEGIGSEASQVVQDGGKDGDGEEADGKDCQDIGNIGIDKTVQVGEAFPQNQFTLPTESNHQVDGHQDSNDDRNRRKQTFQIYAKQNIYLNYQFWSVHLQSSPW